MSTSAAPDPSTIVADIVIVGAGIAGLSCARDLRAGRPGLRIVVVDKARGVGGRCATRRFDGQPVDHALSFLHGSDPRFIRAMIETEGWIDWPQRVVGEGAPCLPRALDPEERRFAFVGGLTTFAKRLAAGIEVVTSARIVEVDPGRVCAADGRRFEAPMIIVTAPLPQTQALITEFSRREAARGSAAAVALSRLGERLTSRVSTPCLTAIAGYDRDREVPEWELLLPGDSQRGAVARISHDSSKRRQAGAHVLVVQATPTWSGEHLEDPPAEWGPSLLAAAAEHLPAGMGEPRWTYFQRWRYANLGAGEDLGPPSLVELGEGRRLGLTGEAFSPKGGVEGAFLAGSELARRLLAQLDQA